MMEGCGFDGAFGWFGMTLGIVVHLAFVAVVILAAIWLFKAVFCGTRETSGRVDALEVLKRRYVNGEITNEEYQRMKKELS